MTSALRTFLLLAIALLAAIVLDGFVLGLTGGLRVVDPFLLVAMAFAVRGGPGRRRALACGAAAGIVQDLLASGVFGVHYLSKLVVAYAASLVSNRLAAGQPLAAGLLVGGGVILEQAVVALLGILLGSSFRVESFGGLLASLAGNVLAGLVLFFAIDRLGRNRRSGPGMSRGR